MVRALFLATLCLLLPRAASTQALSVLHLKVIPDQMEMLRRLGQSDAATDEVTGYGLGDGDDGPVRR